MITGNSIPSINNSFHVDHAGLLIRSFNLVTGKTLLPVTVGVDEYSQALFNAPFAVISHGTESDPVFNYANQCALDLFEMTWQEFTQLPSRFSAEPDSQAERNRVLQRVSECGYVDDYNGVRISSQGKRFQVRDVIVWNVLEQDHYYGQAALIRNWTYL